MRNTLWAILISSLLLGACSRTENHFIVEDPDSQIARADVLLCGRKVRLSNEVAQYIGKAEVDCEGEGTLSIQLKDGATVSCKVGYVTPGAIQAFHFALEGRECRQAGTMGFM